MAKNLLKLVEIMDFDPMANPLVKVEECVEKLSHKDPDLMVNPADCFLVMRDLTSVLVELSLRSTKSEKQIQYLQREVQDFGEREKELTKSL